MNLDELQSVQSRERQTDTLQQLRETFYEETGQFIEQLREERDRAAERADDPFDSPEVSRLTDDINTAEQTVEAIYERRVGKVVKMASLAAADMPTEDDGLTREERDLFETMVGAIKDNRGHVLDVISGEVTPDQAGDGASEEASTDPVPTNDDASGGVDAADLMGGDAPSKPEPDTAPSDIGPDDTITSPADEESDRPPAEAGAVGSEDEEAADDPLPGDATDVARRTVRITDEVGEILGVDQREYDLSTDDVVTLPADNADPLVERDAAEPLD